MSFSTFSHSLNVIGKSKHQRSSKFPGQAHHCQRERYSEISGC